ncbi:MAG: lipoprotein-releasing ABC transporter permease subunit [Betaproteobacteria bacterium]|jgi:lipoprotein-releasing system permease protein|nr:lipoprotein-releasing ABC transporter permease subunit [Betaproteobacteria bacterium]NBP43673.1 lipoprotein-releasing ABC transporter permease subunit [Betaproteobacteria bacterium]
MSWRQNPPFELALGWRYTRSARSAGRNGFISFISTVSMLGIGLGVAALIIVLSVMNGFQKEVRQRMLGVIPHVQVVNSDGSALADTDALIQTLMDQGKPLGVLAASDEVDGQSLIARGEAMRGAMVRGIDPARAPAVSDALSRIPEPVLSQLQPGSFGVILGRELAFVLGVKAGDQVTLIAPGGQVTPAGTLPRIKALRVLGILDTGHYEYDSALALLHKDDAARIYRLEGPTQIQLRLADPMRSREVVRALTQTLGSGYWVRDWTQHNRSWFAAVQIEKRMMFIILTLIVAVAAFNLVSTLVMTVTDKRADIAILRTLGASPSSILAIFMVQGAVVGVVGTLGGLLLGLLVAFNIDVIVPAIENTLNVSFLPRDIYLISQMPSDPQAADIVPVVVVSLVLALLATLYPSWRASQVQPAEALRHE